MLIQRLDGSGVRNLQPFSLQLSAGNLFFGDNGSGKSSLLEALHVLGTGRSFRGSRIDPVIQAGSTELSVFGAGVESNGRARRLGYRKERSREPEIRVDSGDASLGELAAALPVRFIGPGSEALLDGEPSFRRGLLDWILFHVEPSYLSLWRRANKALAQRNALLRQRDTSLSGSSLSVWSNELAESSARIGTLRASALKELSRQLECAYPRFPFIERVDVTFQASQIPDSLVAMAAMEAKERDAGYSLFGFQRDDIRLRMPEGLARDVLSRGQRKAFTYALLLAEASLVRAKTGKISVLLLDDLCSELDKNNVAQVMELVRDAGLQALFTAISPHELDGLLMAGTSMFHVEQGRVYQAS